MAKGVLRCEMPQPSPPSASAEPRSSCRLPSAIVIWKYKVMAPEPKPTSSIQKPMGTAWSSVGTRPTATATAAPHSTGHMVSGPVRTKRAAISPRSEEHTSELQSRGHLVCRLLLEKKNRKNDQ